MPYEGTFRQTRMTDDRRERLARLEASGGKLSKDGNDAGFLQTVKVTGTQQEADRAQRVLDAAAEREKARKAKKAAKQGGQDDKDDGFCCIVDSWNE